MCGCVYESVFLMCVNFGNICTCVNVFLYCSFYVCVFLLV
jgi:hypothetical protein